MRWLVERTQDVFDDVGAQSLTLHDSGALVFADDNGWTLVYAAGQWITVVPDAVDA